MGIYERLGALIELGGGKTDKTPFQPLGDYWIEETCEADLTILKREAEALRKANRS